MKNRIIFWLAYMYICQLFNVDYLSLLFGTLAGEIYLYIALADYDLIKKGDEDND